MDCRSRRPRVVDERSASAVEDIQHCGDVLHPHPDIDGPC
jgi:hypothetical protein